MHSVGIDIGKRQHVAAICRQGQRTADKAVLKFSADRAGQGKSKMNALGHCMKKSLAIVWGIWRGDHDFQPEPPTP